MDATRLTCPSCGGQLRVPAPVPAGKRVRCPRCQHTFSPQVEEGGEAKAFSGPSAPPSAIRSEPGPSTAANQGVRPVEKAKPTRNKARQQGSAGTWIVVAILLVVAGSVAGGLWWVVSSIRGELLAEKGRQEQTAAANLPRTAPAAVVAGPFDDCLQDIEEAKAKAAARKMDLLIYFAASWKPECEQLENKFKASAELRTQVERDFILVYIDFPVREPATGKVKSPARNQKLKEQYGVHEYPVLLGMDAQGRPFGQLGHLEGGGEAYLPALGSLKKARARRDELLGLFEQAEGLQKAMAAGVVLEFLQEMEVVRHFGPLLEEGGKLAREHDPDNKHGVLEVVFTMEWLAGLEKLAVTQTAARERHVPQVQEWSKAKRFKDPDRAASLLLEASGVLAAMKKTHESLTMLREGLAYQPKDPRLRQRLRFGMALLGVSYGSGFVVAPGGYILTNYHVAREGGTFDVRLPGKNEFLPAKLLATDKKRDIALLRIEVPKGMELRPLALAPRPLGRGETVAALGYPLGDAVGSGLKLTTGVVSGLPEEANDNQLILDAKANPGNSGGPLCDTSGRVVGMVTAKSAAFGAVESYAMALPAADLDAFLAANLRGYRTGEAQSKALPWAEVDRMVSPSVLMVLRVPE